MCHKPLEGIGNPHAVAVRHAVDLAYLLRNWITFSVVRSLEQDAHGRVGSTERRSCAIFDRRAHCGECHSHSIASPQHDGAFLGYRQRAGSLAPLLCGRGIAKASGFENRDNIPLKGVPVFSPEPSPSCDCQHLSADGPSLREMIHRKHPPSTPTTALGRVTAGSSESGSRYWTGRVSSHDGIYEIQSIFVDPRRLWPWLQPV
jgi:hypothetical protein